jgi:hypothetical protein
MIDNGRDIGSSPPPLMPRPAAVQPSRRPWLWLLLALLAAGGLLGGWWGGLLDRPRDVPISVNFIVAVRPSGRAQNLLGVEEPGAVPVRADGWMSLEAYFNQPACPYLVWFDCEGRVVPLYPWNDDTIDVTDFNQPPPLRRPTKLVISPMTIGSGWRFGRRGGLETMLLLARRTPLEQGTRLGALLEPLPAGAVRQPNEVAVLELSGAGRSVTALLSLNRGADDAARAVDEPLRARMVKLRDHFELVRAVRFAHEGE